MLKTNNIKFDIFKLYYHHNANLIGKYQLPQLKSNKLIPPKMTSFPEMNGIKNPSEYGVDFFTDDYKYECFWKNPDQYFNKLKNFQIIISTDYSMLPEMLQGQRIWNCTRNRVMAYYLQENGFNVIPVASWCDEDDFSWCFDGLPEKSSIAISSNGCLANPYGKKILLRGIEELQKQKNPFKIVFCGKQMEELEHFDNIIYYPNHYGRYEEEK